MPRQKKQPEPEEASCPCGRPLSATQTFSYCSSSARYLFHRCECGREWTGREEAVDRSKPVSSDEVLDVHERLAAFEGPLTELLGLSRTP